MNNKSIRRLLILGAFLVGSTVMIQSYWVMRNWQLENEEFNQQVQISLRKVANKLALYNTSELPKQNLIQRRSSNYYAVNINDEIDANILEDFLIREFESQNFASDFEYAVYDCSSDEMVYGNYCDIGDYNADVKNEGVLPKFSGLEYYFVVSFPSKDSYIIRSLWQSVLFSFITLLALGFFIYTSIIILKQKRLSEMQKEFINNMTHEFKTPISSMKIAADVLANDARIDGDERLSKYVDIIKNQNIRLNQQVEKVLDIARIERDALKLHQSEVNLTDLLSEIIDGLKVRINEIGGTLTYNIPDREIVVLADPLHLNNVIHNIIDNAMNYHSGKVVIDISLTEGKVLKIKDQGIGIAQEHLNNVFDKFFRVPTGNVHNVKGFGLGLYYVKSICDAHDWSLNVDSELHKGTTFSIKF